MYDLWEVMIDSFNIGRAGVVVEFMTMAFCFGMWLGHISIVDSYSSTLFP